MSDMATIQRAKEAAMERQVLEALTEPTTALNLVRREHWRFVWVCYALGRLEHRGLAERIDGVWRITHAGIDELGAL